MSEFIGQFTLLLCLATLLTVAKTQYGEIPPPSNNRNKENIIRDAKAKELLKYMNPEADPCQDFYDFACGKWAEDKTSLQEGEQISVQSELEMRVNKDVQVLLNEPTSIKDPLSGRKIKEFYKSCLAVESSSSIQQSFLMNFVKKHGGLQLIAGTNWNENYNWVQEVAKLRANYGLDILIGLDIDTNLHTQRGNSIFLDEPRQTLIPAHLCSAIAAEEVDMHDQFYEELQQQISENMQSWFSLKQSETTPFAGDIVRFEFELCKHMRKEHSMPEENETDAQRDVLYRTGQSRLSSNRNSVRYPRQTLQQLTQQFGNVINFKLYVDLVFDTSINDMVYMRSEEYFHHLARTIRNSAKRTVANYINYRALAVINFPPDDSSIKRPKYCTELVLRYFPKVIGEIYNNKYARSVVRSDIELLYSGISRAFEYSFKVDWMDENTKRAAKQKLANFKIAFPAYDNFDLSNLPLERANYWHKLDMIMKFNAKEERNRLYNVNFPSTLDSVEAPDVRMKLQSATNEVTTGWGLLQPPFYDYYYPNALKYAFVGQRIARELAYAFDEQGWNHHPMSAMRWDEYTTENFRNLSECFRTQHSNYLYNNPDMFRNASKLRELIADSNGLNVAFNAYLGWLDTIDSSNRRVLSKETLTDVNYTNTQLFFISFAQQRCVAKYEEEPPPDFLPLDKHTAERYDVNGLLANNVEFAREFGCFVGTEMNPDDKCTVY